jgi:hypothetical protein
MSDPWRLADRELESTRGHEQDRLDGPSIVLAIASTPQAWRRLNTHEQDRSRTRQLPARSHAGAMRFVAIDSVNDDVLARDVPSERRDGAALLRAGMRMTSALAVRIADGGARGIWIEDELGAGIVPTPEFPADVIGLAHHALSKALAAAPGAIAAGRELDPSLVRQLRDAGDEIADAVLEYPPDLCPINDMPIAIATAPWHAVRVALLGTFVGHRALAQRGWTDFQGVQRFDQFDERLSTLAFGLLVHDIGVAASAGCMGAENAQRAEHISRGSALFPAAGTPAAARSVIHGHHERWDGIGYPERRRQDAIQPNARIAAIADAYDALRASGGGREPLPIHAAVATIEDGAGSRFDPALVAHFLALVPPYPVGHELVLGDGRSAVVVQPSRDRLRPTVRLRSAGGATAELIADMDRGQTAAAA